MGEVQVESASVWKECLSLGIFGRHATEEDVSPRQLFSLRREIRISLQIVAVLAVAMMVSTSFGQAAAPSTGNIAGHVKNSATQAPIVGALVQVLTTTKSATTDSTGYYIISSVNVGTYSVTASATGYNSLTITGVAVVKGQTTTKDFNLVAKPPSGYVDGYVFDSVTHLAISGAQAGLNGTLFTATTNANGLFNITANPGTYTLTVTNAGYNTYTYPSSVVVVGSRTTHAGNIYIVKIPLNLPVAAQLTSAAWNGSIAMIFGGQSSSGSALNQVMKYNPVTDSSTTVQSIFNSARYGTSAVWSSQGQCAYVFGGATSATTALKEVVKYSPAGDSHTTYSTGLPTAVYGTSAVWSGTYAYIFGGVYYNKGYVYSSSIVQWNPSTGTGTTLTAKLPTGVAWTAAAYDGHCAYIFGGYTGSATTSNIVKFNTTTNTVTTLTAKLPYGLCRMVALWDGKNINLFGGSTDNSGGLNTVLQFDVASGQAYAKMQNLPYTLVSSSGINDGYTNFLFGGANTVTSAAIGTIVRYQDYVASPNFGVDPYNIFIGGMVNSVNGNLVFETTDISFQARGFTIGMTRTYNSLLAKKLGPFGYGWTFDYNMSVAVQKYGDVLLTQNCGSQHLFVKNSDGTYKTPPGLNDKLAKNATTGLYTLWSLDGAQTNFNSAGKLWTVVDKNGNALHFGYDAGGKLVRVADDSGLFMSITYNSDGLINKTTDPSGQSITYMYSTNPTKCLQEVDNVNILSPIVDMDYNSASRLLNAIHYCVANEVVAQYGTVPILVDSCMNFSYDASGRATQVWKYEAPDIYRNQPIYPAIREYLINYQSRTSTVATCAVGKTMTVTLNADGLPTNVSGAPLAGSPGQGGGGCGGSSLFPGKTGNENLTLSWTPQFLVATLTDGRGYSYSNVYNSYGLATKMTDPTGNYSTNDYKVVNTASQYIALLMNSTDALGAKTQYLYDAKGNNVKIIDPLGNFTQTWYNSYGLVTKTMDKRGYVTTYTYDSDSNWTASKGCEGYPTHQPTWLDASYTTAKSFSANNSLSVSFTSGPMSYDSGSATMYKDFTGVGPITSVSVRFYVDAYSHNGLWSTEVLDAGISIGLYDSSGRNYANCTYWLACWYGTTNNRTTTDPTVKVIWGKPQMNTWLMPVLGPTTDFPTTDWSRATKVRFNLYLHTSGANGDAFKAYFDDLSFTERGYRTNFTNDAATAWTASKGCSGYPVRQPTWLDASYTSARYVSPSSSVTVSFTSGPMGYDTGSATMYKDVADRAPITSVSVRYYVDAYSHDYSWPTEWLESGIRLRMYDSAGNNYANYTYWLACWYGTANNRTTTDPSVKVIWGLPPMNTWLTLRLSPATDFQNIDWSKCSNVQFELYAAASGAWGDAFRAYFDDFAWDAPSGTSTVSDTFDSHGFLLKVTTPLGSTTSFSKDIIGQTLSDTTSMGYQTSFAYSAGQLVNTTYPDGTYDQIVRSVQGEPLRRVSSGTATTYGINATWGTNDFVTDALNHTTHYYYNSLGFLTKVVDANGHAYTLTYELARLKTITDPMGGVVTVWYDHAGNVIKRQDPNGNITQYSYDKLNRLTLTSYPNGQKITYAYDAVGRLVNTTDTSGWEKTTYNSLGQPVTVRTHYNSLSALFSVYDVTETLSYDPNGNVLSDKFKDPYSDTPYGGTLWNNYTYDALNRLSTMSTNHGLSWRFFYDQDGRRSSMLAASSTPGIPVYNTTYVYDSMGEVLSIGVSSQGGGYVPGGYSYKYDQLGRVVQMSDFTGTTTYAYDALGQLTGYKHNGTWTNFTYDAVGNRVKQTVGSATTTYSYNANDELTSASDGSSYRYDKNGNVVSSTAQGTTTLFTYNYENRVLSATSGQTTVNYNYSGDGRLKAYWTGGKGFYDQLVYSHMPGLATVVFAYYYPGFYKVYWNVPGTDECLGFEYWRGTPGSEDSYFILTDGLGNTRFAIEANYMPQSVYSQSYSPFGVMWNAPTGANAMWLDLPSFQGRRFDPYTGMYDFRARYYDPTTGRFDERDPMSTYGTSAYAFVGNDPLNGRDPSGKWSDTCIATAVVGAFNLILDLIGLYVSVSGLLAKYAWEFHVSISQAASIAVGGVWSFMGWLLKLALNIGWDIITHMSFFSKIKWIVRYGIEVGIGWPLLLATAVYDVAWIYWDMHSEGCF